MSYYGRWFPRQMTKYEKAAKAAKTIARLTKKGIALSPVPEFGGRIAKTFWGKAWCDNIESYRDFAYRLERGRSYVRSGAVIDLKLGNGTVDALVIGSGSRPYTVNIGITPMAKDKWDALVKRAAGKISSLMALAQGELPEELLSDFCNHDTGLFPKPSEIDFACSCPDGAYCCKHVAAVLYGIGRRLDDTPELFFTMRGIDPKNIVTEDVVDTLTGDASSELSGADLGDVFGIALDDVEIPPMPEAKAQPKKQRKQKIEKHSAKADRAQDDASFVKSARAKLGLSQSALGKKIGSYQVEISLVERGMKPLRASLRSALEDLLA